MNETTSFIFSSKPCQVHKITQKSIYFKLKLH